MTGQNIKLYTYGPNLGKDVTLSGRQFKKGICEVKDLDAPKILQVLGRFYDVCVESEFEKKKAEYAKNVAASKKAVKEADTSVGDDALINEANKETANVNQPKDADNKPAAENTSNEKTKEDKTAAKKKDK